MDNNGDVGNPIHVKHKKSTIRKEYLAMHFLLHSDNKRYGSLLADVQNDFICNTDKYPKTLNKAYDMLVNYVNSNKLLMSDDQGTGMSFYQEDANMVVEDAEVIAAINLEVVDVERNVALIQRARSHLQNIVRA